jgi:hypothetical protein
MRVSASRWPAAVAFGWAMTAPACIAAPVGDAASRATVTYKYGDKPPVIYLRASDGRMFELSLDFPPGAEGIGDLTLFRPGHKPSATNLLEPPYRWHGVEPWMLYPGDTDDPDSMNRSYGRHRDIPVRNYPLVLHVDLINTDGIDAKSPDGTDWFVFKNLMLAVELRPAKKAAKR